MSKLPEPVAKDAQDWGNRLDDASWAAVDSWQTIVGKLSWREFKSIKTVVRCAILKYLEKDETAATVAALQARITELEARREKDKEYLRKMDEVIDDLNVADSCINPLVDLRIAVTRLKERAEKAEAELAEARKDAPKHRFNNISCSQCGHDFGPGNFGYSHCDDHTGWSYNLGIITAANLIDAKADAYDRNHGKTDPETGEREYPGDGLDYISELREMADDIRGLKHTSANPGVDLAESSLAKNAERYLWLRDKSVPPHNAAIKREP